MSFRGFGEYRNGESGMELDDDVCMCFHVSLRKLRNYLRIERPRRAAQLSECFGAGTGCGWCRPFLQELFDQQNLDSSESTDCGLPMSADEYADLRADYVRSGKGKPPSGAEPR